MYGRTYKYGQQLSQFAQTAGRVMKIKDSVSTVIALKKGRKYDYINH